jgi:hypothetical protein
MPGANKDYVKPASDTSHYFGFDLEYDRQVLILPVVVRLEVILLRSIKAILGACFGKAQDMMRSESMILYTMR